MQSDWKSAHPIWCRANVTLAIDGSNWAGGRFDSTRALTRLHVAYCSSYASMLLVLPLLGHWNTHSQSTTRSRQNASRRVGVLQTHEASVLGGSGPLQGGSGFPGQPLRSRPGPFPKAMVPRFHGVKQVCSGDINFPA